MGFEAQMFIDGNGNKVNTVFLVYVFEVGSLLIMESRKSKIPDLGPTTI